MVKKNRELKELSFRIVLTGGETIDGRTSKKPSFFITVNQPHFYPKKVYQKGIKLVTLNYLREFPEIKSTNYVLPMSNWEKLSAQKAKEFLYVFKGQVFEAAIANFFMIKNKILYTPKEKILKGVTRKIVIQLAKKIGLEVKEKNIFLREVLSADECFTTTTDEEIMPVVKIDKFEIKNGKPGEITKQLMSVFHSFSHS